MSNTNYSLPNNFKNLEYKLLNVSKSNFGDDWHSSMHFHYFAELFYITSGNGSFKIGEQIIEIKQDDMIIINPNHLHTEYSLGTNPLNYICLGIENLKFGNFIESKAESYGAYKLFSLKEHREEILPYLNKLLTEVENKSIFYELCCNNIFTLFLLYIIRHTNANLKVVESEKKISLECFNVKQYIDEHYKEEITLDMLSDLTYTNKYHLAHSFKKHIGDSPINYLIKKRLDNAKLLLETTNYTIEKISDIVGFSSPSYFSQSFKKYEGTSPVNFKKIL